MKLKQFALVISLVVFGTQCANVVAEVPCVTHSDAKKQSLTANQEKILVQHISNVFKDLNNNINWSCLASAVAQFITEHKQVATTHPHLAQLAAALYKTSSYDSPKWIGYELLGFSNTLSHGSPMSTGDILDTLEKKINVASKNQCSENLVDEFYKLAYPGLCPKILPTKTIESEITYDGEF